MSAADLLSQRIKMQAREASLKNVTGNPCKHFLESCILVVRHPLLADCFCCAAQTEASTLQ